MGLGCTLLLPSQWGSPVKFRKRWGSAGEQRGVLNTADTELFISLQYPLDSIEKEWIWSIRHKPWEAYSSDSWPRISVEIPAVDVMFKGGEREFTGDQIRRFFDSDPEASAIYSDFLKSESFAFDFFDTSKYKGMAVHAKLLSPSGQPCVARFVVKTKQGSLEDRFGLDHLSRLILANCNVWDKYLSYAGFEVAYSSRWQICVAPGWSIKVSTEDNVILASPDPSYSFEVRLLPEKHLLDGLLAESFAKKRCEFLENTVALHLLHFSQMRIMLPLSLEVLREGALEETNHSGEVTRNGYFIHFVPHGRDRITGRAGVSPGEATIKVWVMPDGRFFELTSTFSKDRHIQYDQDLLMMEQYLEMQGWSWF